ncbi:MAG: RNA polymerase sigma factor [Alistipes indistinctus]
MRLLHVAGVAARRSVSGVGLPLVGRFPEIQAGVFALHLGVPGDLNTCLTGVRRSIRRPQSVPLVSNLAEALAEPEQMEEELREMYALIRRLGPLERTVVLLYLEENSYQQIADITGLTLCNVATKLKRAKIKLRQMVNA